MPEGRDARTPGAGVGHPSALGGKRPRGAPTPSPHPAARGGDPTHIDRVPSHSISLSGTSVPGHVLETQHRYGEWMRGLPSRSWSLPLDRYPVFRGYSAEEWWLPPLDLLERYALEPVFAVEMSDKKRAYYFWRAMCAARRGVPSRSCPKSLDRRMRRYTKPHRTVRKYFQWLESQGLVPIGTTKIIRSLVLEIVSRSPGAKAATHIPERGPRPEQRVKVVPNTARPVYE